MATLNLLSLLIIISSIICNLQSLPLTSRLSVNPFGIESDENLGICNGEDTLWTNYPQMVSIRNSGDGHCCAATILDLQQGTLLTAAHCSSCIPNWSSGIVKIGCQNPNTCVNGIAYQTALFVPNPNYGSGGSTFNYDVGIIRLRQETVTLPNTLPAPIINPAEAIEVNLDNNPPVSNQPLIVVGYGRVAGQTTLPDNLQMGDVNVWSQSDCQSALPSGANITPQMVCARGIADNGYGITTCSGDSGLLLFVFIFCVNICLLYIIKRWTMV